MGDADQYTGTVVSANKVPQLAPPPAYESLAADDNAASQFPNSPAQVPTSPAPAYNYQQPVMMQAMSYVNPVNTMYMQPVGNVSVINSMNIVQPCFHPNLLLNYTYDKCMLTCIIISCIIFGFFGSLTLLMLDRAKNYTCSICGHKQTGGRRVGFYVTFGIFAAKAGIIGIILLVYIAILNQ